MKFYDEIKSQCDDLGISISYLCKRAEVDRTMLERWKKKNPYTLDKANALTSTLSVIRDEKKAESVKTVADE